MSFPEQTSTQDPFRETEGKFKRYGTSVFVALEAWMARALGLKSGTKYWTTVSADNRSITIHLDDPNGEQKSNA